MKLVIKKVQLLSVVEKTISRHLMLKWSDSIIIYIG